MQIAAQPTGTSDAGSVSPSGISLAGATDTVSGSSRSSKEEDEEVASAAAATVFQVDRGTAEGMWWVCKRKRETVVEDEY